MRGVLLRRGRYSAFTAEKDYYIPQSTKMTTDNKIRMTAMLPDSRVYHIIGYNKPDLVEAKIVFRSGEKEILAEYVISLQNTGLCIVPDVDESSYTIDAYFTDVEGNAEKVF